MLNGYTKNRKLSRYFQSAQLQTQQELKRYSNLQVQYVKDGPWEKAKMTLSNLAPMIAAAAKAGQIKAALEFKKAIIRNIQNGGSKFGFPALSSRTLMLKGKRGQSATMFNASKTYGRSIILINKGNVVRVGVKPGAKNNMPGSNLTVMQYATILEYGSDARNIPARPLWKRTWRDMGGAKTIKETIRRELAVILASKGFK